MGWSARRAGHRVGKAIDGTLDGILAMAPLTTGILIGAAIWRYAPRWVAVVAVAVAVLILTGWALGTDWEARRLRRAVRQGERERRLVESYYEGKNPTGRTAFKPGSEQGPGITRYD